MLTNNKLEYLNYYKMPIRGEKAENLLLASEKSAYLFLHLVRYLCERPCRGVIKGLKKKPERLMLQVFWLFDNKESLKELMKDCPGLWHWEGDDLHVDAYDTTGEVALEKQLAGASQGGKASAAARRAPDTQPEAGQDAPNEPPSSPYESPDAVEELITKHRYKLDPTAPGAHITSQAKTIAKNIAERVKQGEFQNATTQSEQEERIIEAAKQAYKPTP